MKRALAGGAALAIAIGVACSEDENTDPLPCTSAPPWPIETKFPNRDPNAALPKRVCTARCGDTTRWYWGAGSANSPAMTTLPSGPCSAEGEGCAIGAVVPCCEQRGGTCEKPSAVDEGARRVLGIAKTFECRCRGGEWSCATGLDSAGSTLCPRLGDAGGDAN